MSEGVGEIVIEDRWLTRVNCLKTKNDGVVDQVLGKRKIGASREEIERRAKELRLGISYNCHPGAVDSILTKGVRSILVDNGLTTVRSDDEVNWLISPQGRRRQVEKRLFPEGEGLIYLAVVANKLQWFYGAAPAFGPAYLLVDSRVVNSSTVTYLDSFFEPDGDMVGSAGYATQASFETAPTYQVILDTEFDLGSLSTIEGNQTFVEVQTNRLLPENIEGVVFTTGEHHLVRDIFRGIKCVILLDLWRRNTQISLWY